MPESTARPVAAPIFTTTQWQLVSDALGSQETPTEETLSALNQLCAAYRHPLYVYARRWGLPHHDAEDAVQQTLCLLVRPGFLQRVDPQLGRFRSFLLGVLQNHVRKLPRRSPHADPEAQLPEAQTMDTPEADYDREFALALLHQAQTRLTEECARQGRTEFLAAVLPYLAGSDWQGRHAEIGRQFGMEPGAVRVAVHRLRKRFGQLLRAEVGRITHSEAEAEAELRVLLAALSR